MRRREFLVVTATALGSDCSGLVPSDAPEPAETVTPVPTTESTPGTPTSARGDEERPSFEFEGTAYVAEKSVDD